MITVIDSSVAIKWYAAEQDSELARTWIGRPIVAPDLIRAEVANALWKKVRLGQLQRRQTGSALPHLAKAVKLLPSEPFAEAALELSLDLGHPSYDCFFLEIARVLDFPLITADRRLWTRTRQTTFEDRVIMLSDWGPGDG